MLEGHTSPSQAGTIVKETDIKRKTLREKILRGKILKEKILKGKILRGETSREIEIEKDKQGGEQTLRETESVGDRH